MTREPRQLFSIFPSSGVPIYRQIMDQVRMLVASGRLTAGDFLPSVRRMATDLEVNPMTVSKAYSQLELVDVVERVRGQGMCVRGRDQTQLKGPRLRELTPLLEQAVARAYQLSLSRRDVLDALAPMLEKLDHE